MQYIDDECSIDSEDDYPSSQHHDENSGSDEETEEDRAFIDNNVSEEIRVRSPPVVKKKVIQDEDDDKIEEKQDYTDLICDEEDDEPKKKSPAPVTCAQEPKSPEASLSPVIFTQRDQNDIFEIRRKEAKKVNVIPDDVVMKAKEAAKSAPVVTKKKQVRVESISTIDQLLDKVENNKNDYMKDRSLLVIDMIKYLQKYK